MKKLIFAALFIYTAMLAAAQESIDLPAPKDPRTMAMGGAFLAMSEGYQSFYGNPASFAAKKAELTFLSVNPWFYFAPTQANIASLKGLSASLEAGDESDMLGTMSDLVTGNGLGGGASLGLGWVGKGLAIGMVGSVETYLQGPNLLGARGNLDGQMAVIVGIGLPVKLGPLTLNVGGDIRPFLRMRGLVSSVELMSVMEKISGAAASGSDPVMAIPVSIGFGMALDLGARIDLLKFLSVGLSIRDITTKQNFVDLPLGTALGELQAGTLSSPDNAAVEYAVYPNITLGATLTPIPQSVRKLVDVAIVLEIQDPIKMIQDKETVWSLLHVGTEASFFKGLVKARAGLNKGWVSFGAGVDVVFAELNVALFTEELGRKPGDRPRTGLSAEFAFRF